ncbi:excinuclease ABC subunit UvrA [Candidatus Bipolaricaulota bacterium]|nr:excinuclease ABC subunit UvrA [Candidatus Bipolaricaulota bacterium]MBS3791059.1 excinuclease ABC subunit UvrA [Candidatus Bipolaricaulota bacterium]
MKKISIKGAGEHNLKDIDLEIPRDKLIVISGLSGSGKSSLAFDTIYAEGRRRYLESLSAYARRFLGQMEKPDVDFIEGLSPSISIDQKTTGHNPRSTVGTATEIYDYLRLLYAHVGVPHCPNCGKELSTQTAERIIDQVMELEEESKIYVLAPVVRGRKGEYQDLFQQLSDQGYLRVRVDGRIRELEEDFDLEKYVKHDIEVVVDRLIVKDSVRSRVADSVETALNLAEGNLIVKVKNGEELTFSEKQACSDCGISVPDLTPRMFSFNSPYGACEECDGLGKKAEVDPDLVLDRSLSIDDGAILPWRKNPGKWRKAILSAFCKKHDIPRDRPIGEITGDKIDLLLYGDEEKVSFLYTNRKGQTKRHKRRFKGVLKELEKKYRDSSSSSSRKRIEEYMAKLPCPECGGGRLNQKSLAVTVSGKNIDEVTGLSIDDAYEFFNSLDLSRNERLIAGEILDEIKARLGFLLDVGLDYLTLDREAGTLSGGEAHRIKLATQIGSGLTGVLYILDEPTVGLHQHDVDRLLDTLKDLRDMDNTVIVVEHDRKTIMESDWVVELGPKAGVNGGEVMHEGSPEGLVANKESLTGQYLRGEKEIPIPRKRRHSPGKKLWIRGAREHNLEDIDVGIPLGLFNCVTGVSGSGKSTLINDILFRQLERELHNSGAKPGEHDEVDGVEHLDKVIEIDQSPIGRTPRSNPATYIKVFRYIRELFAETPEARTRGYEKGRFSFNRKGGRCEECKGRGHKEIEMHFLPDVSVPCEDCNGKRYNKETLQITYKGKTIADILEMTVEEALHFFANHGKIKNKLETLMDIGLGYMKLGQPSTTLSGGEAQRIKLARELSRRRKGHTLYLFDEPTTGLHAEDIRKLLEVLHRLVDDENTVVVIEHNPHVIKTADWIIDLGPKGGKHGGELIAEGTPEEISNVEKSFTGDVLEGIFSEKRKELLTKCT